MFWVRGHVSFVCYKSWFALVKFPCRSVIEVRHLCLPFHLLHFLIGFMIHFIFIYLKTSFLSARPSSRFHTICSNSRTNDDSFLDRSSLCLQPDKPNFLSYVCVILDYRELLQLAKVLLNNRCTCIKILHISFFA
jgi:hypothetical protein